MIKNICVFASSSNHLEEIFYKEARELGLLIGKNNYNVVYGGSKLGLMYACAGAVKEAGGKIFGIMPERLANMGCANPDDCDEFILTIGMRERKAKLDELSDAVIAIAGGFGTLEELSELIVQKQLGYNNKPIVILNTAGFYDKLIEFFETIIQRSFANEESRKLYYIAKTPKEAIDYIRNYQPEEFGLKFVKSKF
ncbi:TIGR00730 family Rossman fold protein [bacterium]|nr:TIGR00730 family Rossman fold protein [bacterium]